MKSPAHNSGPPAGWNGRTAGVVLTREALHGLLDHERARCDRNGRQFAVVVFDLAKVPGNGAAHQRLGGVLTDRLRRTDACGYLDDERLAALLPDTELEPAWTVANDIHRATLTTLPGLACAVYAYPSAWWGADRDDGPRTGTPQGRSSGNGSSPRLDAPVDAPPHDQPAARTSLPDQLRIVFSAPIPRWKRCMDVLGATTALVVLTPVIALTALAVRLSSSGPVLFTQPRVGKEGRIFTFWKFRTMSEDAAARKPDLRGRNEQSGPVFKMRRDPRVTPIGRLLRKSSLDELPQLWNVLKGDMSLVGPRPPTLDEVQDYERWHLRRLDLTPGLTCIWQVSGRSQVGFSDWVRMDLQYARQRSVLVDVMLLARTIPAVLSGRGAH
jgi:lipopolysaccharide/colanic/teichoic acid biosynthesis glycosyltransferase